MTNRDYYADLGVSKDASRDEIAGAFRKLASRHHPDRNPGDAAAAEKFRRAAEAYQVLSDPKARGEYDRGGRPEPRVRRGPPPEDLFSEGDFEGLFEDLLAEERPGRAARGEDFEVELPVDLEEAVEGATAEFSIDAPSPCPACGPACRACAGAGWVQRHAGRGSILIRTVCPECLGDCLRCRGSGSVMSTRTIELRIPPGSEDGARLRLRGQGAPGRAGGAAGDLYVRLRVRRHPVFERDGRDLRCQATISGTTARRGGRITVPLLRGEAEMRVPPGTRSGQVFRLAGQGVRGPEGGRGDLLVTVRVENARG